MVEISKKIGGGGLSRNSYRCIAAVCQPSSGPLCKPVALKRLGIHQGNCQTACIPIVYFCGSIFSKLVAM